MKTIIRTLVILLVAVLVAGALYLVVENTSLLSSGGGFPEGASEFGERPEMPSGELGERPEMPTGEGERFEGGHDDHNAASLSRGLSEVFASLVKIAGITVVVLAVQFVVKQMQKRFFVKPTTA